MKVINDRIADAEKIHAAKCIEIDEKAEQEKIEHEEKMVQDIVGKFL